MDEYDQKTIERMGRRLYDIRLSKHITRSGLSARTGITEVTIERMENGRLPSGGKVQKWIALCNELGCTLDDLTADD